MGVNNGQSALGGTAASNRSGSGVQHFDILCAIIVNNKCGVGAVRKQREMMKKEKVIGVRVTEQLLTVLEWDRLREQSRNPENKAAKTTSSWVSYLLDDMLETTTRQYETEQKRLETAAKRRATLEAKKAANDPK